MVAPAEEGQRAEAVARRLFELFGTGDVIAIVNTVLAPDCVFDSPCAAPGIPEPLLGPFKGTEELERHFNSGGNYYDWKPLTVVFCGASGTTELGGILVTVLCSCQLRRKGTSDAWRTFDFCQLLTVRDGMVHHIREYCDSYVLAAALAGEPAA